MPVSTINHATKWFDLLVAALAAKRECETALVGLIAAHGNKRTQPLMDDLCNALHAVATSEGKTCLAYVSERAGQWTVTFPGKGVGYQTWKDFILPQLPKLRAATSKGKADKAASTDPVESLRRYVQQKLDNMDASQRRKARRLLAGL
jgi:hypothetical protein